MPLIRCPHCGHVMAVNRSVVGEVVGCLMPRCETAFRAVECRRHTGWLSQTVFFGVIGFAVCLAVVWLNRQYGLF